MNHPLAYLVTRSTWNAIRARVRRLRQPKYLAGAIFGIGYFYFLFFRNVQARGLTRRNGSPVLDLGIPPELAPDIAAFVLLIMALITCWILPGSRAALTFSEAEMAFLLPGPVGRSTLVRYKLFNALFWMLLPALFFTFVSGRFAEGARGWYHAAGWWFVLSTLQLHRLAASFALTRAFERGLSSGRRRLLLALGFICVLGGLVAWRQVAPAAPDLKSVLSGQALGPYLEGLVRTGPATWILYPFKLVVLPWFAPTLPAFLLACVPAMLLQFAHYLWVTRADVAFEEASIAHSVKRAAMLAARKSGERPAALRSLSARQPLFALRPTGWAPWALVWKYVIELGGRRRLLWWAGGVSVFLAFVAIAARIPALRPVGVVAVGVSSGLLFSSIVVFPMLASQVVRKSFSALEVMRTLPISGPPLAFGQLLGPALLGAILQVTALAMIAVGSPAAARWLTQAPGFFLPCACIGLLVLPAFNLVTSLVPVALPLLFPGWFRPGEAAGIEATGLRFLGFFGQLLFNAVALAPAVLVVLGCVFLVTPLAGPAIGAFSAVGTVALLLITEAWLGLIAIGRLIDRFDPTEV